MGQVNPILEMLNQRQNPQQNKTPMQQAMEYVQQNGGDPRIAFYKLAKEKGIDPNYILSMLKH